MPIRGMTDTQRAAFPPLGILHKGAARTAEDLAKKRPGKDLEFFRFVNAEQPAIEAAFKAAYGTEPQALSFYFLGDQIEDVWEAWMEERVAGGLVHRCDADDETAMMVLWRTANGQFSTERRPCPYATGEKKRTKNNPGCRHVGRLRILLPGLLKAGYVGEVTLWTGSQNDIMSIQAALAEAMRERKQHGLGLRGIEFILQRVKRKISTPGEEGERARRVKWLTIVTPAPRWIQLQLQAAERQQWAQLTAGGDADEEVVEAEGDDEPVGVMLKATTGEAAGVGGDVVDGEYEEEYEEEPGDEAVHPAPAPAPPPPAVQASETRPYSPEVVKKKLAATVAAGNGGRGKAPDAKDVGRMAGKLAEALGGGDAGNQGRHLALAYLFGKQSSNDLDAAEVNAVLRWLVGMRDEETGKYPLNAPAVEELKRIVVAAQVAAGQETLL